MGGSALRKTYGPWAGLWTIPSGHLEPDESVVETLERGVLEETNVVARESSQECGTS